MSPLSIVYSLQSAVGYPIFQKEYQMISTKMSFFWHPEHLGSQKLVWSIIKEAFKKIVWGFFQIFIFWPEMATGLNEKWPKSCFFNQNGANFRPKKLFFENPCTTFLKATLRMLHTKFSLPKCSGCQKKLTFVLNIASSRYLETTTSDLYIQCVYL